MSVYDLAAHGWHVFPVDHPALPECAGLHTTTLCDGKRGKHPAVAWGHAATTNPKMIATWFEGRTRNVGISCGPSGLVVLDEDEPDVLNQWAEAEGVALPDTYTVTTGKGRHLYYAYDHAVAPIRNAAARLFGALAIDVRGGGGFVVAAGSAHQNGGVYTDNGAPIAALPAELAQRLLAAQEAPTGTGKARTEEFFTDPNSTPIPYGKRHRELLKYAGRLREKRGLDYAEAEILFGKRFELCEQPPGKEASYEQAKQTILDDVYARYQSPDGGDVETMPRLWKATDLRPAEQPRWLAKGRLPCDAVSLLIGDEGIGKSLFWGWIAAPITTGKPLPEFGIPARPAADVILVCTEDDWSSTVRPRLEVAGADLTRVQVICTEDDGSGSPVFPRDCFLILEADPKPALVVVDAWLDTVSAGLSVRDPQQARQALHPWKEVATATGAAVLLLTHTNRVASPNARDRYGASYALRQKARLTLYAQQDDEGYLLIGPEKANSTADVPASRFTIGSRQYFTPTEEHDGTVPFLAYIGESDRTAREHVAASAEAGADEPGGNPAKTFIYDYLKGRSDEAPAVDVLREGRKAGFGEQELKDARRRHRDPRIVSRKASMGDGWVWAIDYDAPEGGKTTEGGSQGGMPPTVPPSPPSGPECHLREGLPPSGSLPGDPAERTPGMTERVKRALAHATSRPPSTPAGAAPVCPICGLAINAALGIAAHHDCTAANTERATA